MITPEAAKKTEREFTDFNKGFWFDQRATLYTNYESRLLYLF